MQSLSQNGEKITPKQWKAKIQSLQSEYDSIQETDQDRHKISLCGSISYNKITLRGNFRTRAYSRTGNKARPNGGKKKFNENLIET